MLKFTEMLIELSSKDEKTVDFLKYIEMSDIDHLTDEEIKSSKIVCDFFSKVLNKDLNNDPLEIKIE